MSISADGGALRRLVPLLPELTKVRWTRVSPGLSGSMLPGPTDLLLYALLALASEEEWAALRRVAGDDDGVRSVMLPRQVAEDLIPADLPAGASDPIRISGPALRPGSLAAGPVYRVSSLVHVSGGLLLSAFTT